MNKDSNNVEDNRSDRRSRRHKLRVIKKKKTGIIRCPKCRCINPAQANSCSKCGQEF